MKAFNEAVGHTSLLIAAWRAQETEQIDPLFIDPIANIFIDPDTRVLADRMNSTSASTRYLINYRTKYFDDCLLREIDNGVKQVILLGAGLDTRSLRLGNDSIRFFEIDHQDVLVFKRQRLEKYGYSVRSRLVPGDYIKEDTLKLFLANGFDPDQETLIIWEGNSMYIPVDAIVSLLSYLSVNLHRFRIAFDYLSDKVIQGTTGFNSAAELIKGFESLGAPWVTGFDDINQLAEQTDLRVVENLWMTEVVASSRSHLSLNSGLFSNYSVCTLANNEYEA